jgi:hypothetical protein
LLPSTCLSKLAACNLFSDALPTSVAGYHIILSYRISPTDPAVGQGMNQLTYPLGPFLCPTHGISRKYAPIHPFRANHASECPGISRTRFVVLPGVSGYGPKVETGWNADLTVVLL